MVAILNFGSRKTSGNVRGDIVNSGMVNNVGIAVGIAAPSLAAQKLFSLPVFGGRHLDFWWSAIVHQRRSTSGSVPNVKSKSGVVENVGVGFEIASNLLPFKSCFQFRFGGRHFDSVVNNVGRHRRRHVQVGRGRKCGGIR
jgi:hypothetical protein